MLFRTSFDRSGSQEFYYVPFFFSGVGILSCWVIAEPFFDANPAAMISIVAADGICGFISRLAFIFRDAFRFWEVLLRWNFPGCWLFKQSPECCKGLINLAPDLGCNT